jgi:DNA (cytosine-5)-methyltransferase 1
LQHRRRVIILGWNKDLNISIGKLAGRSTSDHMVKSIFSGLPKLQAGEGKDKYLKYTVGRTDDYLHSAKIRGDIDILTQHIARPHTEQDKEIYRIAVEKWRTNKERL